MADKLNLQLEGKDGNAFYLMGYAQRVARKKGWTKEEIDDLIIKCTSGDYNHLLQVLMEA